MNDQTLRLFIALNLPAELRGALYEAAAPLRSSAPGRWVARDNLHLTMKFLGQRAASEVEPLARALAGVAAGFPPARLSIGGIGAFPNLRRPRVVWIAVEPDPKLELLQHEVETACTALGYDTEGRPFRPHVTLGRLKGPDRAQVRALARAADQVDFARASEAQTVDLMRSETGPEGSRYTILVAAPLGGV